MLQAPLSIKYDMKLRSLILKTIYVPLDTTRIQGSSRMPPARLYPKANLTELNAWLGRCLKQKSGRNLALEISCRLLSTKVVLATFSKGGSLKLSSFIKWNKTPNILHVNSY